MTPLFAVEDFGFRYFCFVITQMFIDTECVFIYIYVCVCVCICILGPEVSEFCTIPKTRSNIV